MKTLAIAILALAGLTLGTVAAAPPVDWAISVPDSTLGGSTTAVVTVGTIPNNGSGPMVHVQCREVAAPQAYVYLAWVAVDGNGQAPIGPIGPSSYWTAGDAECIAEAGYWTNSGFRTKATSTFHVTG